MRLKTFLSTLVLSAFIFGSFAQNRDFNGLDMNMGNLYRLSNAETAQ